VNFVQIWRLLPLKEALSPEGKERSERYANDKVANAGPECCHVLLSKTFNDSSQEANARLEQHENKNIRHRSKYTCRGFLVVDEAPEDLMPIHAKNYDDYYEEELAVQVCHRGVFSGDVRLVLGLESTDQGGYGVADALWYHVDQSKHIHNYNLRAEVFSLAQAELVLRGSTKSITRHEDEELKGTPQEALHHSAWDAEFEELAKAVQR
jgi:hypothetical protein